jgi:hypothetical protein
MYPRPLGTGGEGGGQQALRQDHARAQARAVGLHTSGRAVPQVAVPTIPYSGDGGPATSVGSDSAAGR